MNYPIFWDAEKIAELQAENAKLIDNAHWLTCVKGDLELKLQYAEEDNTKLRDENAKLIDTIDVLNLDGAALLKNCHAMSRVVEAAKNFIGPYDPDAQDELERALDALENDADLYEPTIDFGLGLQAYERAGKEDEG